MDSIQKIQRDFKIALSWCLAWGDGREPKCDRDVLKAMKQALENNGQIPTEVRDIVAQVEQLQQIDADTQPKTLEELKILVGDVWNQHSSIGLVYGGATKIKQYVFESTNLMEIRGASAILDRINLIDLRAFFGVQNLKTQDLEDYRTPLNWLKEQFAELEDVLIPELIIYATGGNILTFCPAAYVNDLANAIEKRYTCETLTANSCAVGERFRLLEIRFGLFKDKFEDTPWFDWYSQNASHHIVEAYFGKGNDENQRLENFFNTKSFNELTRKLAIRFNQRRSGNDVKGRLSRRYPPHLDTHPYLVRDENNRSSAIAHVTQLPSEPMFSEALARKYLMGQKTKRDTNIKWFNQLGLTWEPGYVKSWVTKFKKYLKDREETGLPEKYYKNDINQKSKITEARNVEEIANSSNNFLSFIYADGNNMGGYIQKIKTPGEYRQFSEDIFEATEQSVYYALANNLHPHELKDLQKTEHQSRNGTFVHPFEIITVGGDDVLILVPANKALAIAKDIGEKFEEILASKGRYKIPESDKLEKPERSPHRYRPEEAVTRDTQLSTSMGVLTIAYDSPIYYANKLANQLLKSAKKRAKHLKKKDVQYFGGTVDILTLKSVTMISSNIEEFRKEGLTIESQQKLQLYATPYTLHEIGGLIKTIQTFQEVGFPRSQLYQIRSLLEQGKRTAILNYRYFAVRLKKQALRDQLKNQFDEAWCSAKTNNGNLAPWMTFIDEEQKTIYETIWRDIVELYPFIEPEEQTDSTSATPSEIQQ
jgi:CRISPR-associated protein Cmr2